MKNIKSFTTRLEAIDWIAAFVQNEGQFEVLREQLNFNFIYFSEYFLELSKDEHLNEVVTLDQSKPSAQL